MTVLGFDNHCKSYVSGYSIISFVRKYIYLFSFFPFLYESCFADFLNKIDVRFSLVSDTSQ